MSTVYHPPIPVLPIPTVDGRQLYTFIDGQSGRYFYTVSGDKTINGITNIDLTPYIFQPYLYILSGKGISTGQAGAVPKDVALHIKLYPTIDNNVNIDPIIESVIQPYTIDDTAGSAIWGVQMPLIFIPKLLGLTGVRLRVALGNDAETTTYNFTLTLRETTIYNP
jgi:hypothetical protein